MYALPKSGYFLSLITIAEKDSAESDLLIPICANYVQELYHGTAFRKNYGKVLEIEVTSEDILRDMKEFMALRIGSRNHN